MTTNLTEALRHAVPLDGEPVRMLPAEAYTSDDVLAWELRHLYAGSWTCLGREDELLPQPEDAKPTTQRAVRVGDVSTMLVRDKQVVRMFANTCRHRGHELLPEGESSQRRNFMCPYHAWSYKLSGDLIGAPGFKDLEGFVKEDHALVELPVVSWRAGCSACPPPGGQRRGPVVPPTTSASSRASSRRTGPSG